MALPEAPNVHVAPSDAMLSLFRRTVMAAYGRSPVDGKTTVSIDRYGFSVNTETIEPGPTPGQRVAVDRWITLSVTGEISKHTEAEPLNERLAREIKGPRLEASAFEQGFEAFRAAGYSHDDAISQAISVFLMRPGMPDACSMLIQHLDNQAEEAAYGINEVDAFELADVIQGVRDNFRLPII